jgi:hypothetical protein
MEGYSVLNKDSVPWVSYVSSEISCNFFQLAENWNWMALTVVGRQVTSFDLSQSKQHKTGVPICKGHHAIKAYVTVEVSIYILLMFSRYTVYSYHE